MRFYDKETVKKVTQVVLAIDEKKCPRCEGTGFAFPNHPGVDTQCVHCNGSGEAVVFGIRLKDDKVLAVTSMTCNMPDALVVTNLTNLFFHKTPIGCFMNIDTETMEIFPCTMENQEILFQAMYKDPIKVTK